MASIYNLLGADLSYDIHVMRIDSTGKKIWAHNIGYPGGYEIGTSMVQTQDSCVVILGHFNTSVFNSGAGLIVLIKIDKDGQILWERKFGYANYYAGNIAVDSMGNLFFSSREYNGSVTVLSLTKADSLGNIIWTKQLTNLDVTDFSDLQISVDGHILFLVETHDPLTGEYRPNLLRFDLDGNLIWAKRIFCSPFYDLPTQLVCDAQGNSYLCVKLLLQSGNRYQLAKVDSSGALVFCTRLDNTLVSSIDAVTWSQGGLCFAGWSDIGQFYVAHTDATGQNPCTALLGSATITSITAGIQSGSLNELQGSVFQSVESAQSVPVLWATTDSCGFTGVAVDIGQEHKFHIYPNPSRGQFSVQGNFPAEAELIIYNMLGELCCNPISLPEGNNNVPLFLALAQGVYFYNIRSEGESLCEGRIIVQD
jgi:hypothetical protein